MMAPILRDRYAIVSHPAAETQLYVASVDVIDELRTHHLAEAGLPDGGEPTMLALWRRAQGIRDRARVTGWPEDVSTTPFLFYVDPLSGSIVWTFEAAEDWSHIAGRLREAVAS